MSPAKSKKQRRFMAMELENKKRGKKTKTNMSIEDLEDFALTSEEGLKEKATPKSIARHIRSARIPKKRIWVHEGKVRTGKK